MKSIKNLTETNPRSSTETGIDELNLCEFPLASISDRHLDRKKTVVFEEEIFDRVERRQVTRRLTLSGSDRYGLPTAKDDDVLLACIQLSKLQNFRSPQVSFSRYELLKTLRWPDESKNYSRLTNALRRWKGLTIFSDRAFYDFGQKSWVNRDFGVFDSLYIYHREMNQAGLISSLSRFTWNEVFFNSFQSGYLKTIDWGLYTCLESAISKRLYRFLDKRFYHSGSIEVDLKDLAFNRIGLSNEYNVAQIKRTLMRGVAELEAKWGLKALKPEDRFAKKGKGDWIVRFERRMRPSRTEIFTEPVKNLAKEIHQETTDSITSLQIELTKRGIGPANAEELVQRQSTDTVRTMIELFDWYNKNNQPRGVGFLVQSIRSPEQITFPRGFERTPKKTKIEAKESRTAATSHSSALKSHQASPQETNRSEAFLQFWKLMSPAEQVQFESDAVRQAPSTKRTGYERNQGKAAKLFEYYRTLILRDHFENSARATRAKGASRS